MTAKLCSSCSQYKAIGTFNKSAQSKDGLQAYCKQCNCDHNRAWKRRRSSEQLEANGFVEDMIVDPGREDRVLEHIRRVMQDLTMGVA